MTTSLWKAAGSTKLIDKATVDTCTYTLILHSQKGTSMRNIFKNLLSCRPSTSGIPLRLDLTCHDGNALSGTCVSDIYMEKHNCDYIAKGGTKTYEQVYQAARPCGYR